MYASVKSSLNTQELEPAIITEPDDTTHENDPPLEDIEDPKWLDDEYRLAYPPNPLFKHSYDCYLLHIACMWTSNENSHEEDRDKFATAPDDFQRMMLSTAGCIMIGDSVVLDRLHMNVTPRNVRVMMDNQIDRENTHQIVYSKWCDISLDGDKYRKVEFGKEFMHEFEEMAKRYAVDNSIQQTLYFIMLCENIMFAPLFLIINYGATKGYSPKLCNDNLFVMRDEYIHYIHARGLLASFRRKLKITKAREILFEFIDVTMNLTRRIIGSYDDGFFNVSHAEQHFRYIVHVFMKENCLYLDDDEMRRSAKLYGDTPAKGYMILPQLESKINLMESTSTIYLPRGPRQLIDMRF